MRLSVGISVVIGENSSAAVIEEVVVGCKLAFLFFSVPDLQKLVDPGLSGLRGIFHFGDLTLLDVGVEAISSSSLFIALSLSVVSRTIAFVQALSRAVVDAVGASPESLLAGS